MLAYVPAIIDLYRPLKPHLRWTMQVLVSFAGRDGRCWPSVRALAEHAGISKSTAARHLAELSHAGIISRKRRPGRGYEYVVDTQFLPRAPVSHLREQAVPPVPRQETNPLKQTDRARARFANSGLSYGELPDDRTKWQARLRGWRQSRFWLPLWGPRPDQAGHFVPAALLQTGG
jgi:DNA-binding transcriptional MocR family regulator